ncbi:MAG TPA: MBL fold metallo-hydrolase [candidate division Zixibacteria bacterium]|nr:MBL fold metallo-hydrolase [candidate division Zixibacteria bacterium]MDD4918867.1 MBL fold metallo-hydrolase [candidate division Zixibacteria bacterium]MDM7973889.1 MBL fold metallo-hydrolase [candidate division Zixibacteria bacterium]HOD67711.1 MBL fold metallo-hydrolase [candidate division Zixibacteria bacterium]HPM35991.1 MBL fold metallo-hydrolase [candidate division Zixibacteria bacterium]
MITLSFHGAAGTVTGSKYLVTVNDAQVLIDCGMFQGPRDLRLKNWEMPPFDPKALEAVIVTHAHIDHIGYLPRLGRMGFHKAIFATPPTVELARLALKDAAYLQEEDAAYRNKKKLTRYEKALPLFDEDDVARIDEQYVDERFGKWVVAAEGIRFRYHIVGHILGAACVEVAADDGGRAVSILFSGDVGRYGNPLTRNPGEPPVTDYLVCESTYGGRIHEPEDPYFEFANLINEVVERRSILLVPAFAIGRTQQIVYLVNDLITHGRVPPIDIHIDSPMAVTATELYVKYADYHAIDLRRLAGEDCVLHGPRVFLHRERADSKELNKLRGPAIILSASGMLTGGRILHHLIQRLPDPKNIVALVGYMAEGTLGRRLEEGAASVYIHKQPVEVRAKVVKLHSLSAHADYHEMLHWLEPVSRRPRTVFCTHGEESQLAAMAGHLRDERGWECRIPRLHESVEL